MVFKDWILRQALSPREAHTVTVGRYHYKHKSVFSYSRILREQCNCLREEPSFSFYRGLPRWELYRELSVAEELVPCTLLCGVCSPLRQSLKTSQSTSFPYRGLCALSQRGFRAPRLILGWRSLPGLLVGRGRGPLDRDIWF